MATLVPIPRPSGGLPILGHALSIDPVTPLMTFRQYAVQLGEIYAISLPGTTRVVVSTRALAEECCDERRFRKYVETSVLNKIRDLVGDALFTAYHGEENWGVAHRILVPAFGPASIIGMFNDMYDILSQLVLKWERFGPTHPIDPSEDFTRLALDTIALCSMSYRLNSFYTDGLPPFVKAMGEFLTESGRRSQRPEVVTMLMRETNAQHEANIRIMTDLAKQIVDDRRADPTDTKDLLNAMLNGVDPQTGKKLTDKSIMEQMITFLIAGHETTSGMLSFFMYSVLKHPEVYAKVRTEIDTVVGAERIRPQHIGRLPYLTAVLREVLRVDSPIPGFTVAPFEDEILGGKYLVKKNTSVNIQAYSVHRDPAVWGDDAEEFKPERMLDGKFEALPPKAWIPFGNGARACIGRGFAWQEGIMAVVTLFQKFDFRMADPSYDLRLKQTLTVKPNDFRIYAIPRTDTTFTLSLAPSLATTMKTVVSSTPKVTETSASPTQPLYVLYGSNTGSCEMFAQRLANEAASHGFQSEIGTLDSAATKLPTDGPVIVITASFEGEPPDNAGHFVKYVEGLSGENSPLADVSFAVFGCGNHDWVHTYQRIPMLVDAALERGGGKRLLERGEADAGGDRFFESFDDWETKLWVILGETYHTTASDRAHTGINVKLSAPTQRASRLRQPDAQLGTVRQNVQLTKPGAVDKHHLEIELPEGMTYRAGDYLAILPTNPASTVRRVLSRFNITEEQEITISSSTPTTLPTDRAVTVHELFSGYVELQQPATRKNIEALIQSAATADKDALERLLDNYVREVLEKRVSVLSLLETYSGLDVPLATFVGMLPAMRVRQYSISSSPLWDPAKVTLTLGILREASLADSKELFQGVASNYLANLLPGDHVQVAVRPSSAAFHLPAKPETSIVMFASGSGIAPMRGFLQERAAQKTAGREVGKTLLFFGCRSPDLDFLYADTDLKAWTELGILDVRPAFSRAPELSEGCKYVQDRVWHDRKDVSAAFRTHAKFYTCGSARVALGIKETCIRIYEERKKDLDLSGGTPILAPGLMDTPEAFWATIQNERYAADVFG
ncbi:cytochrome P450 [Auricularia subglabra TFB-10046 SS5]|nr:cytochrome P450 [Auricularia subglabra TFB-10046 SS5]